MADPEVHTADPEVHTAAREAHTAAREAHTAAREAHTAAREDRMADHLEDQAVQVALGNGDMGDQAAQGDLEGSGVMVVHPVGMEDQVDPLMEDLPIIMDLVSSI